MTFTRDQAYEALAAMNPAPIFLQAYQTKRLTEDLDLYFRPPEELFLKPNQQDLYTEGRLIPLLDDGSFGVVTFLDPATRALAQIHLESPEEIHATFACWSHYVADLMVRIGESVDDDERLRRIAALLQFSHIEELFAFFDEVGGLPYAEYEIKKKQFIVSIPTD